MKRDDVNGARCRSDGVWMALARDYVKQPLKDGTRNHFDLISIVVMMGDGARVVSRYEPTTWTFYNTLVNMREWSTFKPSGHGYYLPAIDEADALLTSNANAGCSLSLLFFSDGKPSDRREERPQIVEKIGKLASKFGRRLSIACIGMAEESEDFSTLNDMVTEARQYGSQATFGKPTLDAGSLSRIISSLASSLTTSKTEMTELRTGNAKMVRMDIVREKFNTPDHIGDWKIYTAEAEQGAYVNRFWSWNIRQTNGFVEVLSKRCCDCYDANLLNLIECPGCKAYYLCNSCYNSDPGFKWHGTRVNNRQSECQSLLQRSRMGTLVRKEIPSWSIAVKEQIFGEGAERIVRKGEYKMYCLLSCHLSTQKHLSSTLSQVRYLNKHGEITGPVVVAKESRFVGKLYIICTSMHPQQQYAKLNAWYDDLRIPWHELR